ncbi:MAG: AAA family ATPase [bacterium]
MPDVATLQTLCDVTAGLPAAGAIREPWRGVLQELEALPIADRGRRLEELAQVHLNGRGEELIQAVFALKPGGVPLGSWDSVALSLGNTRWLWEDWLPEGFLVILAAESGAGKSALALWLCRCLALGEPWPDGSPFLERPSSVLWVEGESAAAINIRRAQAWGCPLDKIKTPLPDPLEDVDLENPAHREAFEAAAARPEVRLVVVDSYRGVSRRRKENDSENALSFELAGLAARLAKPVLCLHHLKKQDRKAPRLEVSLDDVRGSGAVIQPARLVLAIDTPAPEDQQKKRLLVVKDNLGPFPAPLGFSIGEEGLTFGEAPSRPIHASQIESAVTFLRGSLADGPRLSEELRQEAEASGLAFRTLRRAKDLLAVNSEKGSQGWLWSL